MKILIAAQGDSLNSQVSEKFGRSKFFIIYDSSTERFEALENKRLEDGANLGIRFSKFAITQKAEAVIAGRVGKYAFSILRAANIKTVEFVEGSVKNAINNFLENRLKSST